MPDVNVIEDIDTAIVTFLSGASKSHARQAVRRLKRLKPSLRVGILMPTADGDLFPQLPAEELNADFVATSISQAIHGALSSAGAVELRTTVRRLSRPSPRRAVEV